MRHILIKHLFNYLRGKVIYYRPAQGDRAPGG